MAKGIAALEQELEEVARKIEHVSRIIQKGDDAYASSHAPSPVLEKLRREAQRQAMHESAQRLLDEWEGRQKRTERWMRDERSVHLGKLRTLKRRQRTVRSRLRAAKDQRIQMTAISATPPQDALPLQRHPVLNYKSNAKRAILHVLLTRPDARTMSVLQICSVADEEGAEVPASWRRAGVRSLEAAYNDRRFQQHVHRLVNKVKTDLREKGLL